MGWWQDLINAWRGRLSEQQEKPKPTVTTTTKPSSTLIGHYWGTSDEVVPGMAIVMPPKSLTGIIRSVTVNGEYFVYKMLYRNGQQIWYGTKSADEYGDAEIQVETASRIYTTKAAGVEPVAAGKNSETLWYRGRTNGDRATWYGKQLFSKYPRTLRVTIPGFLDETITHNGVRYETSNLLVKQSDSPGRGIAILANRAYKGKTCTLGW